MPWASSGDMPHEENELSPREQSTYDAALDVLAMYFRGEMDYGDVPPKPLNNEEPPDDPEVPVPVT
jgi:hypothetical protein